MVLVEIDTHFGGVGEFVEVVDVVRGSETKACMFAQFQSVKLGPRPRDMHMCLRLQLKTRHLLPHTPHTLVPEVTESPVYVC